MKKVLLSVAIIATSFTGIAQVGIGTTDPHVSAALEVKSTTLGFLPPRMTDVQMEAIVSPVEGLVVYCTDCVPKGLYFHNGVGFLDVVNQVPSGVSFVTSETGRIWMDRNLGATQVATSSTDAASYGDLYQWGRDTDGHQIAGNGPNIPVSGTTPNTASTNPGHGDFIITNSDWLTNSDPTLWQGVDGVNNPCPNGFRLPTEDEWLTEFFTWNPFTDVGAINSPLALPLGGNRSDADGSLNDVGGSGYYWSSTTISSTSRYLLIGGSLNTSTLVRARGASIRCIKD